MQCIFNKHFASLPSSVILSSVDWEFRIDVSAQLTYYLFPEYGG